MEPLNTTNDMPAQATNIELYATYHKTANLAGAVSRDQCFKLEIFEEQF
jgi:hypothetical protein